MSSTERCKPFDVDAIHDEREHIILSILNCSLDWKATYSNIWIRHDLRENFLTSQARYCKFPQFEAPGIKIHRCLQRSFFEQRTYTRECGPSKYHIVLNSEMFKHVCYPRLRLSRTITNCATQVPPKSWSIPIEAFVTSLVETDQEEQQDKRTPHPAIVDGGEVLMNRQ